MNAPRRTLRHMSVPRALDASDRATASMRLACVLLLGALLLALAWPARAALYKWTDERGVVHYSDTMPADAVNRASFQLNQQGLTVRKTEQAKPVVQRVARDESDEARARQAERERVIAQRRDKALLESYTNEQEIDLAKTRAVATLDGQVESAQSFVGTMQKRREELEGKKATFAPRPVPGSIEREIETIDAEVARQQQFIVAKKKEAAGVAARYDADKQRYRELRGEASGSAAVTEGARVVTAQGEVL